jgi:hypothetical protein
MATDRKEEIERTKIYKNLNDEGKKALDEFLSIPGMTIKKLYELIGTPSKKEEPKDKANEETSLLERFYEKTNISIEELLQKKALNTSAAGTKTGLDFIDKKMTFNKKSFGYVQAITNHGKTTFLINLGCRFLQENEENPPLIVFLPFETPPEDIATKFLNAYSCIYEGGKPIIGDKETLKKYYAENELKKIDNRLFHYNGQSYIDSIKWYKTQSDNLKIFDDENKIEGIKVLMENVRGKKKDQTIIFILDYIQIMDSKQDKGTQANNLIKKEIAYSVLEYAKDYECIAIGASQINEDRQARESASIKDAASWVIDILKNDHTDLLNFKRYEKKYSEKVAHPKAFADNRKENQNSGISHTTMVSPCTLSINKNRGNETYAPPVGEYNFIFDGYQFMELKHTEKIASPVYENEKTNKPAKKQKASEETNRKWS